MAEISDRPNEFESVAIKDRARRVYRPKPIALYLLLLVAVAILPALVFSVVLLHSNNRAQHEIVATLTETSARSITEAVEREVSGMVTTLRVLSTAPSLREDRLEEYYAWVRRALLLSGAYLVLLEEDFEPIFSTRVPFGMPLGRSSDAASLQEAVDERRPVVSGVFFGRTAEQWLFNVAMPVFQENEPPRVLLMTRPAENLTEVLTNRDMSDGWRAAIIDRAGNLVASSVADDGIGAPFFLPLDLDGRMGSLRLSVQHQGSTYEVIANRSSMTGWWVVSWIPGSIADEPMRRSLQFLILGGLFAIVLAAGAATLLARQVARSVGRLARDAKRLGSGEPVEAIDYPIEEIATVSRAISEASRDRKEAENEIRFLMREVAHRSKNQLTVVSSIAKQSARNARNFAAFQESFQKRIQGLARSTDLLVAGGVAGIEFRDILAVQIEPFRPSDPARLEMEGPDFRLGNHAAQTLGMAVHELATNAAKYGAFAAPAGRLLVSWAVADGKLTWIWREKIRGLRRRPEKRGFGTEVIERMVGRALDAELTRTVHADGLEWRFAIPVEKLAAHQVPESIGED